MTGWSGARAVRLVGVAGERNGHRAYWAALDPPGPHGEETIILAPRYDGDSIAPPSELPLTVDIWLPGRGESPGQPVDLDAVERDGIGELYSSPEAAAPTTGGW
ncbi:MAG: hypothetical protein M3N16_01125 [Actinomycetota bacterium]|nr:hypothetical protein [Actinomycetota bacterium]